MARPAIHSKRTKRSVIPKEEEEEEEDDDTEHEEEEVAHDNDEIKTPHRSKKKKTKLRHAPEGSAGIKVRVCRPESTVDPIVVSFPCGVPASILQAERKMTFWRRNGAGRTGERIKKRESDEEEEDDDNEGGSNDMTQMETENDGNDKEMDTDDEESERYKMEEEEDDDDDDDVGDDGDDELAVPTFTWQKVRSGGNRARKLTGRDPTCTYQALVDASLSKLDTTSRRSSFGGSSSSTASTDRRLKTYVAVYDRQEQTLTFQPCAVDGRVFSLSQTVHAAAAAAASGNEEANAVAALSYADRRRLLVESFGSTQKKRALKSEQANMVHISSVVGEGEGVMNAVESQQGTISESNRQAMGDDEEEPMDALDQAYAEARRRFLPPFDETAEMPHKVYSAKRIAGDAAWGQISRVVDACVHKSRGAGGGEWRQALLRRNDTTAKKSADESSSATSFWPASLQSLLLGIVNIDTSSAKEQVKTLLLLHHIMKFRAKVVHRRSKVATQARSVDDLARFCGLPPPVAGRCFELFAVKLDGGGGGGRNDEGEGYSVTKQLLDKCHVHILLLYMLAQPPSQDMKVASIHDICKDLAMETDSAALLLREAGCTVRKSAAAGITSVSLTTPLKFPPPRRMRARRQS